jgi:hypothetical protein
METLNEHVMIRQRRDKATQDSVLTFKYAVGLAGARLYPRPEKRGQRRLTEDREAEAPFSHERQPADDLPIFGYDRGAPRFPGEGIQPPWLLKQRMRARSEIAADP